MDKSNFQNLQGIDAVLGACIGIGCSSPENSDRHIDRQRNNKDYCQHEKNPARENTAPPAA